MLFLIFKHPKLTLNRQSLRLRSLHVANDLAVNIELLGNGNHLIGGLFVGVYFQTMAHIEDLVHFVPIGARGGLDHLEQGRQRQHVVLHDV